MPAKSQKQANLFRAALGDPKPGTDAEKIKSTVPREKIKNFTNVGEGKSTVVRKNPFKLGDKVKLRDDVLKKHSTSVPAHLGYTREQFAWRKILDDLSGETGTVTKLFDNSKHVNVNFGEKVIGIDYTELVPAIGEVEEGTLEILGLPENRIEKLKEILRSIVKEVLKESNYSN